MDSGGYNHIHFGPGQLGLGLVAWLTTAAGFDVWFATDETRIRTSKNASLDSQKRYWVREWESSSIQEVVIRGVLAYGTPETEEHLTKLFQEPKTILVTTALRAENLPQVVPVLARLLVARSNVCADCPLFVIAVENTATSTWLKTKLEAELARTAQGAAASALKDVTFLDCMANRVCGKLTWLDASESSVCAPVNTKAQLVVSSDKNRFGKGLAEYLRVCPSELEFASDVPIRIKQKLYLLNGPHLLISIFAFVEGYAFLSDYLASPKGASALSAIFNECRSVFLATEPASSEDHIDHIIAENIEVFVNGKDSVSRILSRFSGKPNLSIFFSDFHVKLGSPALNYMLSGFNGPQSLLLGLLHVTESIREERYPASRAS